jgi:hypothetical protein
MTRLLFIPSLLLWIAALVYRLVTALEEGRENDSWLVLSLCLLALAYYVGYVGYMHLTDQQWTLGWRH